MYYFTVFLFCLIPVASIAFFITSLIFFRSAVKSNKQVEGSYSKAQIKNRKLSLIISSVIMGIVLTVVIGVVILLYLAIRYM